MCSVRTDIVPHSFPVLYKYKHLKLALKMYICIHIHTLANIYVKMASNALILDQNKITSGLPYSQTTQEFRSMTNTHFI